MNRRKIPFILLLALIIFITLGRDPTPVEAASSPYDVENSVRDGWRTNYGGKSNLMESGRNLIYDIYSDKYISNGYTIQNRNFGKGTQPYLKFYGWSVIFGHKKHTSTNHETYIAAIERGNSSNVKIYGTLPYGNLSASEDLEYNKNSSTSTTVWNECPSTATNRVNTDCNMTYTNVGFEANIPLNELFPNETDPKSYDLFLVKRVDSHIVYTPLNVPFDFDSVKFSNGEIDLSSGVNAKQLLMRSYPVIRRSYARSGESGYSMGYFTQYATYRSVASNETSTAIWFGVSSPHDGGSTRWASSAYWTFGGDQATIAYMPNAPPKHISHSLGNSAYQNGSDYWVKPGSQVTINLRQYDKENENQSQYLRLYGDGQDVRRHHRFYESSLYNHYETFANTSNVAITSAYRTENTQYGGVRWYATPYTHGHSYSVMYYYRDLFGNNIGYDDTGMDLRVDGIEPVPISETITGARYINGSTYWTQSGDLLEVNTRQHDPDSGNEYMYFRVLNNSTNSSTSASGIEARNRHHFDSASNDNSQQIASSNFAVSSVARTENTAYGSLSWKVTPRNHGSVYNVQTYYQDHVGNNSGTYRNIGAVRVDDVNPVVAFRNTADTANFYSNSPSNTSNVSVRLKFSDADSGYRSSRYGWSTSSTTSPTSWSAWTSNADYTVTQNNPGGYYLWVQAYDNTDNLLTTKQGPYYAYMNKPPVANITHSPSTVYNDTTVTLFSNASDADGDSLSYQWAYRTPGSSTWVNFSTEVNPSRVFSQKGQWNFRLAVSDGSETVYDYHSFTVENRAPVGQITYSPTPVYNNTTVQFNSNSSDADKDNLTYQWAYQTPGSTTWVNFSTAANPTRVFNQKGTWNVRLIVSDGTVTTTDTQAVPVENRAPVANFSWNPATVYNNTNVTFSNSSSDQDGDTLTYQWAYQAPGSTTWVNFSGEVDPARIFNQKGNWNVRLVASDGAASHSSIKTITVSNRAPVANFSWNPSTIYNNTSVTFSNASSDVDELTYQWAYQAPGSTTWVNFSNAANPSRVFNQKGSWNIRLIASDGTASATSVKTLVVTNRAPVANFSWNPTTIYNNTTVTFSNSSNDQDGDLLTYQWAYQEPGSTTWVNFSTVANPSRVFNQKGSWNVRLIVSDGTASGTSVKTLSVTNRAPVANFSWSPSTVYNNTTVTFSNASSDADLDAMTYQWAYQEPGSTSWVNFSTAQNPSRIFNRQGTWNVRLIVSDGTVTDTEIKALVITNRAPVSDFIWNPSSVYTNTTVAFTNRSTDADGDPLTYQWAYQKPGTTTWTNFSAIQHPSSVFNEKGNWNIRLITSDGRTTHAVTKTLTVLNTPPQVTLNYAPTTLFEGDTVTLTAVPNDIDGDSMTVILEESINGVWTELKRQTSVASNQSVTHSFVVTPRQYTIRVRAIDPDNGTATQQVSFSPTPLEIAGFVNHTPEWKAVHEAAGHESNQFYAGEIFLPEALVTDYPIESVTVTFSGKQIDGQELILQQNMASSHPKYTATIEDERMGDPETQLQEELVYFLFTAKWTNGITKDVLVGVNIVDTMYESYDFYRSN